MDPSRRGPQVDAVQHAERDTADPKHHANDGEVLEQLLFLSFSP